MLEGYGITEASPVISVNVPDQIDAQAPGGVWQGHQTGSVGRPLIGLAVRFRDVETDKILAPGETGLLEVRGVNIFNQYLSDPHRTREALVDGWYRTGDLARMDENGFLYLAGRLSRFSKMGGEMVPHGTIEQAILKVLNLEGAAEIVLAVSSQVDPQKGEQLVVLHTMDLDVETVRKGLVAAGLPNLWVPKVFKKVPKVPILGTGKLDLNTLKKLAGG
jgi:acyl-[acyl-carrier-protein]-phospholipid O-acyltransferase/long-chain-fatty-acid--[acyl-carrier-protein] ligase